MSTAFLTPLLTKVLWSAIIVIGLTFTAERVSQRFAGLLAGAPLSAVLLYFFVGRDLGVTYVVDSVPHGVASLFGTLIFVLVYYSVSSRLNRFSAPVGLFAGLCAYLSLAFALVAIPFNLAGASALTFAVVVVVAWLFRRIEFAPVVRPVRYTIGLLLLRGGSAAVVITMVITVSEVLGTRWTGLMAGFPSVLVPSLMILHLTYGKATTHAMLRSFPIGITSLIFYVISVPVTFPLFGVAGGTAASLVVSLTCLTLATMLGRVRLAKAP